MCACASYVTQFSRRTLHVACIYMCSQLFKMESSILCDVVVHLCVFMTCVCVMHAFWCACVLTCRSLLCVVCSRCRAADVIVWCGTDVNVDDWPNETGPRWWSEFTQNSRNNRTLKSRLSYWCIHFIGAISEHVFSSRAVCNDSTVSVRAWCGWLLAVTSTPSSSVLAINISRVTRDLLAIFGI